MSKGTNFVIFALGVAVGSAAAWYFAKTKYEAIMQEEADSFRKAISRMEPDSEPEKEDAEEPVSEERSVMDYARALQKEGYRDYADISAETPKQTFKEPYVIPPDEFGENEDDGFEVNSLYYYRDKILADDDNNIVDNVKELVGPDFESHFGEYSDDCVYVRNERLKCDFEILLEQRTYAEFLETHPYKAEV